MNNETWNWGSVIYPEKIYPRSGGIVREEKKRYADTLSALTFE